MASLAKRLQVQSACRDCKMCTGHAFTGGGRAMRRGAANVATFGVAALARHQCKLCGHPMTEHQTQAAQLVAIDDSNPARWIRQEDGRHRWWNGECWTDYFTNYPADPVAVGKVMAAFAGSPPRWVKQDNGRLRWWAGEHFTDDWKADPERAEAVVSSGAAIDLTEEIKKLAELHQAGVLTDEEFTAGKKKVLGI